MTDFPGLCNPFIAPTPGEGCVRVPANQMTPSPVQSPTVTEPSYTVVTSCEQAIPVRIDCGGPPLAPAPTTTTMPTISTDVPLANTTGTDMAPTNLTTAATVLAAHSPRKTTASQPQTPTVAKLPATGGNVSLLLIIAILLITIGAYIVRRVKTWPERSSTHTEISAMNTGVTESC